MVNSSSKPIRSCNLKEHIQEHSMSQSVANASELAKKALNDLERAKQRSNANKHGPLDAKNYLKEMKFYFRMHPTVFKQPPRNLVSFNDAIETKL